MNSISSLFLNDTIDAEIEAFCASDPEFVEAKRQFYAAAHEIKKLVGRDLYNALETSFGAYWLRASDLYYLYGLGLRQEILQTIGMGG